MKCDGASIEPFLLQVKNANVRPGRRTGINQTEVKWGMVKETWLSFGTRVGRSFVHPVPGVERNVTPENLCHPAAAVRIDAGCCS